MNEVLFAKLAWRYISQPHLLWAKMFKCKYGDPDNWHDNHRQKLSSVPWRSLMHGYKLLKKGLGSIQDGRGNLSPWWEISVNGQFTTKLAYNLQADGGEATDQFRWEKIWRFSGPDERHIQCGKRHMIGWNLRCCYGVHRFFCPRHATFVVAYGNLRYIQSKIV